MDEDLQYSPYLSSPERMGLSPFRGSWRGLEVGGEASLCYSVTRYTLHFYTSHVNKGIKIVEFKSKKSIINKE